MTLVMVDANVFVRALVGPRAPTDEPLCAAAAALFDEMESGVSRLTTTDAVIAEVIYVLHRSPEYRFSRERIARALDAIIGDPGFRIDGKDAVLTALERWATTPTLSFVDCLLIERARAARALVASFDQAIVRNARAGAWAPSPA